MNNFFINLILPFLLLTIIYYGTKLVNYYYNFYHIYNFLDNDQKLSYFKNTTLINFLKSKKNLRKIVMNFILIPIIKITYLFILLLITLLYSLYYNELKDLETKNTNQKIEILNDNTEFLNDNTEILNDNNLEENFNIISSNNSNDNLNENSDNIITKIDDNVNKEEIDNNLFNYVKDIEVISTDCDNNILNIINKNSEISLLNKELNLINNIKKIDKKDEINFEDIDFGEYLNDYVENEETEKNIEDKPKVIKIGKKKK